MVPARTLVHPGAILAYRQALGHNPRYESALYSLVISHLILGQDDKASRHYQNLLLLDPQLAAELSEHF
jgi:tetratricopeptide (TPR) repeat protein